MLKTGMTHKRIAEHLGIKRGTVGSKALRLGFSRGKHADHRAKNPVGLKVVANKECYDERAYTSYGVRTTLDKLERDKCRWPMFDDSGFCGGECVSGGVYCAAHDDLKRRKSKKPKKNIDWNHWKPV